MALLKFDEEPFLKIQHFFCISRIGKNSVVLARKLQFLLSQQIFIEWWIKYSNFAAMAPIKGHPRIKQFISPNDYFN